MPRRERPATTQRSEHWLRVAVNQCTDAFNVQLCSVFSWLHSDALVWLSPVESDDFAEYYDDAFLDRLGVGRLQVPLSSFWPRSGPRWDGLARSNGGRLLLVEAKAYIEEGVDYRSKAGEVSFARIQGALAEAKTAFKATEDSPWEAPFYQYANRLAHLYFLRELNRLDAYLLFLYFADAPDVPKPCSIPQWDGAVRLTEKCLGLGKHPYRDRVKTLICSVPALVANGFV